MYFCYALLHSKTAGTYETLDYINSLNSVNIQKNISYIYQKQSMPNITNVKSNTQSLKSWRQGLKEATFVLKFFDNGFTLGIQVKENIFKASKNV